MAKVNGKEIEVKNISLLDYMLSNGFDAQRVAVEINGEIIKRGNYGEYIINESDSVEIVCFVGGG